MTRGRKPKPTAVKIAEGNPGERRINGSEPRPPASLPASLLDCPSHLSNEAKLEWDRIAVSLNRVGLLTQADRSTMAGYCQCYGRWVEAELKLAETPAILRMPSGYIQQSPWLTIANKQLELMARYMAKLGLGLAVAAVRAVADRAKALGIRRPEPDHHRGDDRDRWRDRTDRGDARGHRDLAG